MIRFLLIAALVHYINAACPAYTTKPDYDYTQYAGTWYEVKRFPNVFEDGFECAQAIYGAINGTETHPDAILSVINAGVLASGNSSAFYGSASQTNASEPGHLTVHFPGRPDGGYFVLDTDYSTFSAVYECKTLGSFTLEYAWIMSRTRVMPPDVTATALAAYERFGINVTKFENTWHGSNCTYLP